MSTRAQLRFVNGDGDRVAQVYNHSDGYPTSIIPELRELRDTLAEGGWVRGPEYAAAQFIFLRKLGSMEWHANDLPDDENPFDLSNYERASFLGGHGVETGNIHGDEQYIYEVTVPQGSYKDSDTPWSVKVSGDRHDGAFESPQWETRSGDMRGFDYPEGETAWDHATWDYTGPLDGAVEKYTE